MRGKGEVRKGDGEGKGEERRESGEGRVTYVMEIHLSD